MNNVPESHEEEELEEAETYADEIKNYLSTRDCSILGEK
jgi:hypothetical protein